MHKPVDVDLLARSVKVDVRVLRVHSFSIYLFRFLLLMLLLLFRHWPHQRHSRPPPKLDCGQNLYNPSTSSYVGSGYTACGSKVPTLCLIKFTISLPFSHRFHPFSLKACASWTDAAHEMYIHGCRCVPYCIRQEWCGLGRWTFGPRK